MCIPITDIMKFKIYNGSKMCVIGVSTGSAYANWIRTTLEMAYKPADEGDLNKKVPLCDSFYCPLLGGDEREWIIWVLGRLSEEDLFYLKTLLWHSEYKDFICDFKVMDAKEVQDFLRSSKIFTPTEF